MSPNLRKGIYAALISLNAALAVMAQENVLPAGWAHACAIASLVLTTFMHAAFNQELPPKPPEDK